MSQKALFLNECKNQEASDHSELLAVIYKSAMKEDWDFVQSLIHETMTTKYSVEYDYLYSLIPGQQRTHNTNVKLSI